MDITIDTIISAIEHCSNKQESEMIRQFKAGHGSWAGIVIEEMLSDYLDSLLAPLSYQITVKGER